MRTALITLAASLMVLTGCSNQSIPDPYQRSRVVAEGHRPPGLTGERTMPTEMGYFAPQPAAEIDPRTLTMLAGSSGFSVSWQELVSRASQADVVLIGEQHGHATAQAFMAALYEEVATNSPSIWLSMEFFERDQQTALDDYLAGVTNEGEFRELTRRNDGNYPAGHRAMVETSKRLGRPVIASNAPRRYVRLARTAGFERLETLGPEQQRMFVVPQWLSEGRYREEFEKVTRPMLAMGSHAHAEHKDAAEARSAGDLTTEPTGIDEKMAGYFRAQNVWDATMADSVARPAMAGARPVVHVVGAFHTDFEGGLTERIRRLGPNLRVLTISLVDDRSGGGALRMEDKDRADVVVYLR